MRVLGQIWRFWLLGGLKGVDPQWHPYLRIDPRLFEQRTGGVEALAVKHPVQRRRPNELATDENHVPSGRSRGKAEIMLLS